MLRFELHLHFTSASHQPNSTSTSVPCPASSSLHKPGQTIRGSPPHHSPNSGRHFISLAKGAATSRSTRAPAALGYLPRNRSQRPPVVFRTNLPGQIRTTKLDGRYLAGPPNPHQVNRYYYTTRTPLSTRIISPDGFASRGEH